MMNTTIMTHRRWPSSTQRQASQQSIVLTRSAALVRTVGVASDRVCPGSALQRSPRRLRRQVAVLALRARRSYSLSPQAARRKTTASLQRLRHEALAAEQLAEAVLDEAVLLDLGLEMAAPPERSMSALEAGEAAMDRSPSLRLRAGAKCSGGGSRGGPYLAMCGVMLQIAAAILTLPTHQASQVIAGSF